MYPQGCKHDPAGKSTSTAPDLPPSQEENDKLINDPKIKQLFEALGNNPDLKDAVEGFRKLLSVVSPKGQDPAALDPATAAKALRDASAKVAAVKGKQQQNNIQIEASQKAMVALLKVQKTLELEEAEADTALAKATADHKAVAAADTTAKKKEETFFADVHEEMEINEDPEVAAMDEYIQKKREL